MITIDPSAFHSALDSIFGFVGYEATKQTPAQSRSPHVRFPGSYLAAADLGVDRTHLHRVLTGERRSETLTARWKAWLKANPEFATLQRKAS